MGKGLPGSGLRRIITWRGSRQRGCYRSPVSGHECAPADPRLDQASRSSWAPGDGDQSQDGATLLELRAGYPNLRIGTEWQMDGPTQANLPGVTSRRG